MNLTYEQACSVRARFATGETQTALALEFGVSQAAMSSIVLNKTHKHAPSIPLPPEEQLRLHRLKRNARELGCSVEEIEALDNVCYICGATSTGRWGTLHNDHDHATQKLRGKLCINCNQGLGSFRDSIELLEKAIAYLMKARQAA